MLRRFMKWTPAILLFNSGWPAWGQEGKAAPDPAAMVQAGRATMQRLQTESASWTVTTESPSGARFIAEVEAMPEMRRIVLSIEVQGRRAEFARIIQRDSIWYVTQPGKAGKYRPYEAPIDFLIGYFYLTRADLFVVVEENGAGLGAYTSTKAGVATYRSPVPEPTRRLLETTIADYLATVRAKPGNPELARAMGTMKDLLERGIETRVDIASGMILQYGTAQRQSRVVDFRWRDRIDPGDFAVDGRDWEDFTDDPTAGDLNDLVMIGHAAMWRPGMKSPGTDGRLLDLKTGRYRRIPFAGAEVMPGCFLADRTRVAVTGLDATGDGAFGLYEVNLKTGANRRLGGDVLAGGFTLFPVLSPDGKTLAVLHKGAAEHRLDSQICLVDVQTGTARRLSEPHDMAFPSWLPDGRGLIVLVRVPDVARNRLIDTIARMDLEGKITHLRRGEHARRAGRRSADPLQGFRDMAHLQPRRQGREAICRRTQGIRLPGPGAGWQAAVDDAVRDRQGAGARGPADRRQPVETRHDRAGALGDAGVAMRAPRRSRRLAAGGHGPRELRSRMPRRGRNRPAQGNALGPDGDPHPPQALKGRRRRVVRRERGCVALSGLGRGIYPRAPRALPWADFFGPFRARKDDRRSRRIIGLFNWRGSIQPPIGSASAGRSFTTSE